MSPNQNNAPNNPSAIGPELHDIVLPEAIHNWPVAIGWWAVLIALILLLFFIWKWYQYYKEKWAYRKEALKQLQDLYNKRTNNAFPITEISALLKRVAVTAYPNQSVKHLFGQDWFDFINKQVKTPLFDKELITTINHSLYQEKHTLDIEAYYQACTQWIKQHPAPISFWASLNLKRPKHHV